MFLFVILLVVTGFFAYFCGNLNSRIIASDLVYHRNLYSYPQNNQGLSALLHDYDVKKHVGFAAVIILRAAIPILIGGWLMLICDAKTIGRVFAMFCFLLGQIFPFFYRFKGQPSSIAFLLAALFANFELGIVAIIVFAVVYVFTRYISLSTIVSALFVFILSIIAIDVPCVHWLYLACFALVLIDYRRSIPRLIKKTEPKYTFKKELSYMFDEKRSRTKR